MDFCLFDFLKSFLEGRVDHVIYRDYIVHRRFLIYCSRPPGTNPLNAGDLTPADSESPPFSTGDVNPRALVQ